MKSPINKAQKAQDKRRLVTLIYKYTYPPAGVTYDKKGIVSKFPQSHHGMAISIIDELTKFQPTSSIISEETWMIAEEIIKKLSDEFPRLNIVSIWHNLPRFMREESVIGEIIRQNTIKQPELFVIEENKIIKNNGYDCLLVIGEKPGQLLDAISGKIYSFKELRIPNEADRKGIL